MKGGPSIKVLIDLALGAQKDTANKAAKVLKTQVFLYEADTDRLIEAYQNNNPIAEDILVSYSKAEFFTKLPEVENEIKIVTYVATYVTILISFSTSGSLVKNSAFE